jgi:hypothetical protein
MTGSDDRQIGGGLRWTNGKALPRTAPFLAIWTNWERAKLQTPYTFNQYSSPTISLHYPISNILSISVYDTITLN